MTEIYDFEVRDIHDQPLSLSIYRGKVLLIVNVASECGFTPQYKGLEWLARRHRAQGFEVLGFPCNQFRGQEPGTHAQIEQFCHDTFDVTFPLFAKIDVNGSKAAPLFTHLKHAMPGLLGTEAIKWNFTKFLVGREGAVVGRFGPRTPPEELDGEIERMLRK